MLSVAIRADLWDIEQSGCDNFLDRVHGELGATGVTVRLLHGPGRCLRTRVGASPRVFSTTGGIAFQPDEDQFRATRLRPAPADWLRSRNPMTRLADAARERGVSLAAELDPAGMAAWVAKQERGARKNAFGEVVPGRVCLNDPDARECLLGVAANANAAFSVTNVSLCGINHTGAPAGGLGADLGPVAAWLLDLCFCESCRQQMATTDIDAGACARRASALLETAFETGRAGFDRVDDLLENDETLRAVHRWSEGQAIALLKALHLRTNVDVTIIGAGTDPSPLVNALHRAALGVCWSYPSDAKTAEDADALITRLTTEIAKDALELRYSMSPPRTPDAQSLVRTMTRAVEAGVRRLRINDYGAVPTNRLDWMRQAIRFASRAAS